MSENKKHQMNEFVEDISFEELKLKIEGYFSRSPFEVLNRKYEFNDNGISIYIEKKDTRGNKNFVVEIKKIVNPIEKNLICFQLNCFHDKNYFAMYVFNYLKVIKLVYVYGEKMVFNDEITIELFLDEGADFKLIQ